MDNMSFSGRRITFPIVLDDRWCREALERYMRTIRNRAVYLPSNIEYLARNNGLEGGPEEALKLLIASDWVKSDLLWAVCNADLTCYGIARIWRRILSCLSVLDTREHSVLGS